MLDKVATLLSRQPVTIKINEREVKINYWWVEGNQVIVSKARRDSETADWPNDCASFPLSPEGLADLEQRLTPYEVYLPPDQVIEAKGG